MTLKSRYWLWLLVLVPVGFGLARLRFDVDVLNLLPSDVNAVQGLKLYQEYFANARELIVTVKSPDAEETEKAAQLFAEALRQQTNLVEQAVWQPPWQENPGAAANFLAYLWFNQAPEAFGKLTNRLSTEGAAAAFSDARDQLATSLSPNSIGRLSYDPLGLTELPPSSAGAAPDFTSGQQLFASADGKFHIISIRASTDLPTYRACIRWLDEVRQVVAQTRARNNLSQEIKVSFTGRPAFVAEASSGMQSDMTKSVGTTILVIVTLFWWAHRRWRPLVWLLTLLSLVLAGTLGFGGLFYGNLNVVSVGFAAILLGLAVDYGLVLYQESLHDPDVSVAHLRRTIGPGIFWSAITTSGAFLMLNFGGLPGLGQLGSLVALGVFLGAAVMVSAFLPPLMHGRVHLKGHGATPGSSSRGRIDFSNPTVGWALTSVLAILAAVVLVRGLPRLDHSAAALRPSHSEAYDAVEQIQNEIGQAKESYWLVVGGTNTANIAQKLAVVQDTLEQAQSNHLITSFTLPTTVWPNPENQLNNRAIARQLSQRQSAVLDAALSGGFTSNSVALAEEMMRAWKGMADATNTFWPTDQVSDWVMGKVVARSSDNLYALGLLYPNTNLVDTASEMESLESNLPDHNVWLASWSRLGLSLLGVVEKDIWRVLLPMGALLLTSLWLAFRRTRELLLSLITLGFSFVMLLTIMKLAGWSWNLLNMMALPLLLGAGVDYSIHIQIALRRHHGNIATTRRTVGRALLLCAATTITGFGSNVWSSNEGLVSLGQVCAAGIACAYLSANFLLPIWWRTVFAPQQIAASHKHK